MEINNELVFDIDGKNISIDELMKVFKESKDKKSLELKAITKRADEKELKPYQGELIKLQKYLEDTEQKMIILLRVGMLLEKVEQFDELLDIWMKNIIELSHLVNQQRSKEHNGFIKNIFNIFLGEGR